MSFIQEQLMNFVQEQLNVAATKSLHSGSHKHQNFGGLKVLSNKI